MGRFGNGTAICQPRVGGCSDPIATSISREEWLALSRRLKLSPQQGDIVRLLLTLPWHANSNAGITLALNREADDAKRKARRRKPIRVSTVDTQVSRVFAKLNVHSRGGLELAQRVDAEIAVMRGWIKFGQNSGD